MPRPTSVFTRHGQRMASALLLASAAFSTAAAQAPALPLGWSTSPQGITVAWRPAVDTTGARSGKLAYHVVSSGAAGGAAGILQGIRADDYRGKRVRFSVYVRASISPSSTTQGVGVWMRVDGSRDAIAFDNGGVLRVQTTTTQWTRLESVLDVPAGALGITFAVDIPAGVSEAWVDDASFEVVGPEIRPTGGSNAGVLPEPTAAQIAHWASNPRAPTNLDFESGGKPIELRR